MQVVDYAEMRNLDKKHLSTPNNVSNLSRRSLQHNNKKADYSHTSLVVNHRHIMIMNGI